MKKLLLPTLVLGAVLSANHLAHTQSASDRTELANYRVALDQLSAGNAQNARFLLEAGLQRGQIAPESAVLLAYLEEKAGNPTRARQTLEGVAAPTSFTAAYLSRLGVSPAAIEVASKGSNSNAATLESTDARVAKLEKKMWQIVNDERKSHNLAPLVWDARIASVSRAHSAEMRDRKYFAHESPTPGLTEPLDRYVAGIGNTPRLVAENIYRAWGSRSFLTENDIRNAHKSLMDSPGHRSNILLDGATKMGIGITANASGDIWITQMFCRVSNKE